MPTTYAERFGNNTELIHAYAKDNSPRASEIKHLYEVISRKKAKRLLNVPFEGNLVRSVVKDEQVTFADFIVPETLQGWDIVKTDTNLRGIPSRYFDAVVSIAGIHHLTDHEQFQFVLACKRTLKKNGRLLLVEVKEDSPTSHFLDDFVGRHTPTGHAGNYLRSNFVGVIARAGYGDIQRESVVHEWVFADTNHMYDWMTKFFGLSTISERTLLAAVHQILGIRSTKHSVSVFWKLDYISAED